MARRLESDFYLRDDVLAVARELIGKVLCSAVDDRVTKALITETEAYAGVIDRASHAWGGRRTRRTEPMYAPGGVAYVYLCYGIHHLFNVVSGSRDVPHAVLVRAGVPFAGIEVMCERRGGARPTATLMGGPGTLTQALGIRTALTGTRLDGGLIWIEDHGLAPADDAILTGPRIGVGYAGEDAALPYRFRAAPGVLAAAH